MQRSSNKNGCSCMSIGENTEQNDGKSCFAEKNTWCFGDEYSETQNYFENLNPIKTEETVFRYSEYIEQVHLEGVGHPTSVGPAHLQLLLRGLQEEERRAPLADVHKVDAAGGKHLHKVARPSHCQSW